ncbi:MAG: substrate-binding domain-containing protein [Clostridiales bacterium]|nr:substrate-binding domain-containing protein [Clostridiales bacterium]
MKKLLLLAAFIMLTFQISGCSGKADEGAAATTPPAETSEEQAAQSQEPEETMPPAVDERGSIMLSTTLTKESGILDRLLNRFTRESGWIVGFLSLDAEEALQKGRDGEVDVLLVNSKEDELKFIEEGFGVKRLDVMYNDFLIVGPKVGFSYNDDAIGTLQQLVIDKLPFISRGDDSETHKKEKAIWKALGIETETLENYETTSLDMAGTLKAASEKQAFTLVDRATWTKNPDPNLEVICEKAPELMNYYSVIAVNPTLNEKINAEGGQDFVDWMTSQETQDLIARYGSDEKGDQAFIPNAIILK